MIKLISRILHANTHQDQVSLTIIIAEPKTGDKITILLTNSMGQGIEIDETILDEIKEAVGEIRGEVSNKKQYEFPKPENLTV